jgi:hypothetical protein
MAGVAAVVRGGLRTRNVHPVSVEPALQHVRAKQQIIHRLIDGELGLFEAAARFWQVQKQDSVRGPLPAPGPNPQDGEGVCRTVIGWAYLALADRPEQANSLSERLESELTNHLTRFGLVALPELR